MGFVYATCHAPCPILIQRLKAIEARTAPGAAAFVAVSLDPERDTPEALRALARARHVDESRWRLLRAPEDTVREIAAVLGIKYRRLPDGSFNHSSVITLLDPAGVILARDEGTGGAHTVLLRSLRAAQSTPGR